MANPVPDMLVAAYLDGDVVKARARAEGPGGIIGDALLTWRPGDPGYEAAHARALLNRKLEQSGKLPPLPVPPLP